MDFTVATGKSGSFRPADPREQCGFPAGEKIFAAGSGACLSQVVAGDVGIGSRVPCVAARRLARTCENGGLFFRSSAQHVLLSGHGVTRRTPAWRNWSGIVPRDQALATVVAIEPGKEHSVDQGCWALLAHDGWDLDLVIRTVTDL